MVVAFGAVSLLFYMLFRREGARRILMLSLFLAAISAVFCIANSYSLELEAAGKYLKASAYLSIGEAEETRSVVSIEAFSGSKCVEVWFVDFDYFRSFFSYKVIGRFPKRAYECVVGILLARSLSVDVGDNIFLKVGERELSFKVVGIVTSWSQADFCVLVPLNIIDEYKLKGVSFTLFREKPEIETALGYGSLTPVLSEVSCELVNVLNVISSVLLCCSFIYSLFASFSIISSFEYEFWLVRALGTKKSSLFIAVILYYFVAAITGSLLGVSLGICFSQAFSTALSWFFCSKVKLAPFLKLHQYIFLICINVLSSMFGFFLPLVKLIRAEGRYYGAVVLQE